MYPPSSGQAIFPPEYLAGGLTDPPLLVWGVDPPDDFATGLGAGGLGVAIADPCPPGIVSVWPMTRLGSSSSLAWMMS
jgi:hypothetical protein